MLLARTNGDITILKSCQPVKGGYVVVDCDGHEFVVLNSEATAKLFSDVRGAKAWITGDASARGIGPVGHNELEYAFRGTDFGGILPRNLVPAGVLKFAMGYSCGHTLEVILRDRLRLIGRNLRPTKRGEAVLREVYSYLVSGAG